MDDLSDGVSKLQEFSSVLSSVTRGLDKNVRRLEDQFNKANSSLKEMKEAVNENKEVTTKLRSENESQLKAMQEAVSIASSFDDIAMPASEFMLDPVLIMDTRSTSIIQLEASERQKEEDAHHKASTESDHKSWMRLVDDSTTLTNRQLGQDVNEKVHHMNRTLLKPKKLTKEEELEEKKMTDAERASAIAKDIKHAVYPFPDLNKNSTFGEAMSAIIQRMYRLENAVTLQSGVNEALVKIIRDDTQMQTVYNTLIDNIVDVEKVQRELATDNAKLRTALGQLGDHVEAYEQSMSELARGGKLRIEKRHKRGERNIDEEEVVAENIEWGLDAYTVEESDILEKRLSVVEAQLSANGSVGVALRRIGNDIEELQSAMIERQEAEENIKKAMEENSSSTGILKKKIALAKAQWTQVAEDLKFGVENYAAKNAEKKEEPEVDDDADVDAEDGDEEEEEEEEEEDDTPKKKLPVMITKLTRLYEEVESALVNTFIIHENLDDTLEVLCPRLDELTLIMEEVFALDASIRFGGENDTAEKKVGGDVEVNDEIEELVTLADVMTINREYNLKPCLQAAMIASIPVIDEMVDKIGMRRRIEKIEAASVSQDVLEAIERSSKEMQKQLKTKANKEDMATAMSKRVLKSDINRLRELVLQHLELSPEEHEIIDQIADESLEMADSIADGSSMASSVARSPSKAGFNGAGGNSSPSNKVASGGSTAMPSFGGGGASSSQVQELSTRIELLLKHMQDLQTSCQTFIPREEVQEAMKAVLYEIKVIKMNTVNVNKFKEVTDLKADREEMHSLMQILNDSLGDMMGMNVSSAAKLRCLLCDKPAASVSRRGEIDRSVSPPRTRGATASANQQLSQAESILDEPTSLTRPSTSQPRLISSSSASRLPDTRGDRVTLLAEKAAVAKAQITTEITILKNSVDLPSIDPNHARNHMTEKRGADVYKSRVRSSGGGGSVIQ